MTNTTGSAPHDVDELLGSADPIDLAKLPDSRSPAAEALHARLVEQIEPDPRRSFPRPRVAIMVATLAAVAAALAVLPGQFAERGRVSIVEHALAAVSTGPVLHVVLEVPRTEVTLVAGAGPERESLTVIDLASGQERPMIYRQELWYDAARGLLRQTSGSEDTVVWAMLQTPDGLRDNRGDHPSAGAPQVDPALAAFFKGYKGALEEGDAIVTGNGTVEGRSVQWLRFAPRNDHSVATEIAVDDETYEPVLLRAICPRCTEPPAVYRVVTLEGISAATADFTPPAPRDAERVAAFRSDRETIEAADASAALGRTALWPGREVEGIELSGVQLVRPAMHSGSPATAENLIRRGVGLQLFYGARLENGRFSAVPREPHVTISQAADYRYIFGSFNFNNGEAGQALTVVSSPVPPEGQAALISLHESYWTAQLRKDGLFVEVDGPSRELVLAAARSLRPLR